MIAERSALNYRIQLRNTATIGNAAGTFEDYLPKGVVVNGTPTATPSSGVIITSALETSGAYAGHYKVSGTYNSIAPGAQIEINISCSVPRFDTVSATNNMLSNQASSTWTIGPVAAPIGPRINKSNYVLHEVFSTAVPTAFTKVSADNINTGLADAQFALYRWEGAETLSSTQREYIIDTSLLVNAITGGQWIRTTYDGEDASTTSDVFTSANAPLGLVDFGRLAEGVYTIVETKAAPGYAVPVGQWILTIDPDKGDTGNDDYKIEFVGKSASIMPPAAIRESSGGVHTYKIINARPFTVGMSGLGGTKGMLLAGFVLMAVTGNAFMVHTFKQRKHTKG